MQMLTPETEVPTLPSVAEILKEIAVLRYVLSIVRSPEARRDIGEMIVDRAEQVNTLLES